MFFSIHQNVQKLLFLFARIAQFLRFPALFALALLPFIICIDVTARLFGIIFIGGIEIETNLLVICTFCFLPFLEISKGHMSIDFVYIKCSSFWKNIADLIVHTLSFTILSMLAYQCFHTFLARDGFLSDELRMPINVYYFFPFLGLFFSSIISFFNILQIFLQQLLELYISFFPDKKNKILFAQFPFNKSYLHTSSISKRAFLTRLLSLMIALSIAACIYFFPNIYRALSHYFDVRFSYFFLGSISFCLIFFLLFCKMPIAFAMCLIGTLGLMIARSPHAAMSYLGNTPYSAVAQNAFVALPMFMLMGTLILHSGISKDLFHCANTWIGNKAGGLGIASIAGCSIFASISGDSMSTAVTMGSVALPEMQKLKYDTRLATGALAAGGTLGILIPPSAALIIYGIVTETSISRLFIAGIIPGILLSLFFMLYIYYVAKTSPERAPRGMSYSFEEKIRSLSGILPILLLLILVLGGIMGGFFSPTEGGGVGVMGAFLFALVRGKVTLKNMISSLEQAGILTAKLMAIMIGVGLLSYFFATTRLPFLIADFVTGLPIHRFFILGIIVLIFILLGCMMNLIPMLTLILPSLFPSVIALGFDPIWFGIVCVIVIEMGQITPPVGLVVFALASIDENVSISDIFKGIFPFFCIMVFTVFLITMFPQIVTFLPDVLSQGL